MRTPFSIKSKSSTRLSAAMPTIIRLKPMPIGPDPLIEKVNSKKTQHKLQQIEQHDRAGRGNNPQPEVLCHRNQPGAIRKQQNEQRAKCQAD